MTALLISRADQIGVSALLVGVVLAWIVVTVWEHR